MQGRRASVLLLAVLWLSLSVGCAAEPEAPSTLIGVWETHAEGYNDQHIFIDSHRIGFGTSAVTADGYVITQVTETKEDAKTLYVIAYQDAEKGRYQLAFYYEPSNGGRIIFKNQEQLAWTRKAPVS
ncbi:MAG: hypothetical protein KF814_09690 [Nitrospiraceae bacterium]|nr:hypothetical protein [Nitrospiraceae bacterium]